MLNCPLRSVTSQKTRILSISTLETQISRARRRPAGGSWQLLFRTFRKRIRTTTTQFLLSQCVYHVGVNLWSQRIGPSNPVCTRSTLHSSLWRRVIAFRRLTCDFLLAVGCYPESLRVCWDETKLRKWNCVSMCVLLCHAFDDGCICEAACAVSWPAVLATWNKCPVGLLQLRAVLRSAVDSGEWSFSRPESLYRQGSNPWYLLDVIFGGRAPQQVCIDVVTKTRRPHLTKIEPLRPEVSEILWPTPWSKLLIVSFLVKTIRLFCWISRNISCFLPSCITVALMYIKNCYMFRPCL